MPKTTPHPDNLLFDHLSKTAAQVGGLAQQQTQIIQDWTRPGAAAIGASGASGATGASGASGTSVSTAVMISGQLPNNLPVEAPSYPYMRTPNWRQSASTSYQSRPHFGHQIIDDSGAVVFEANETDLVTPNRFEFSYNGLIPSSTGLSAKYAVHVMQAGYIYLINASLGTVDLTNPVVVGFYINGVQVSTLSIPCVAAWSSYVAYNVSDTITLGSGGGLQPYSACCITAGHAGLSAPSWTATAGAVFTESLSSIQLTEKCTPAQWQIIDASFCFRRFPTSLINSGASVPSSGVPYLPGNADDYLQTKIESYSGTTASDLHAHVRVR
jgi:hypothetical protein